jgi:hypothetical protein
MQDEENININRSLPELLPAKDHEGNKMFSSVPEWLKVSEKMEWPDRWVSSFEESIVLTVKGDARFDVLVISVSGWMFSGPYERSATSFLSCPHETNFKLVFKLYHVVRAELAGIDSHSSWWRPKPVVRIQLAIKLIIRGFYDRKHSSHQ